MEEETAAASRHDEATYLGSRDEDLAHISWNGCDIRADALIQ